MNSPKPQRCDIVQPLDGQVLDLIDMINARLSALSAEDRIAVPEILRQSMLQQFQPTDEILNMCAVLGMSIATSVAKTRREKLSEIASGN